MVTRIVPVDSATHDPSDKTALLRAWNASNNDVYCQKDSESDEWWKSGNNL